MEQNSRHDPVIVAWLSHYTAFICESFELPHDQGLLQKYLALTARDLSQSPATSLHGHSTSYPEIPNFHDEPLFPEIPPNCRPVTDLGEQPPVYPKHYSAYNSEHSGGEVNDLFDSTMADSTTFNPDTSIHPNTIQGQVSPYDQQLDSSIAIESDLAEASAPLPHQIQTSNQAPNVKFPEYDPLWVQNNNVDHSLVQNFKSRMKFEAIFSAGVIKTGDVLIFRVSVRQNGQDLETEAHLKIIGASRHPSRSTKVPNLSVTLLSDPGKQYPVANACQGTTPMIRHLQKCNISVLESAWQDIEVFRGQQALGSVRWITKSFHLWRDQKDQEAQEKGQYFRRRYGHGKGVPKGTKQHNGRFGTWQDGVFLPDPNQGRFRATG